MKKIFSLLAAVLFAGSMMATTDTIFTYNGKGVTTAEAIVKKGGTLTPYGQNTNIVADQKQKGNMCIKINKGYTKDGIYYYMAITLDEPLQAGDQIQTAAFRTGTNSCIYGMDFNAVADSASATDACQVLFEDNLQILSSDGIPVDTTFTIPAEAAGARFIRLYRKSGSTGLWIANFTILRGEGGGDTPADPTPNYYLVGTNNGWSGANYEFAANPGAEGEYMLDVTFAANDEFKVIGVLEGDTTWFPAEANNCTINEAGDYTVYFRPDYQGGQDWYAGCIYNVKHEPLPDPTNCAEAAEAALSVSANNELYKDGAAYTITGYVTSIKTAYSDQYHNISFWMADAVDGGEVLQAYRAACASETDAPVVGDKVAVTGSLTKYNTTPEFAAGCTFEIIEHAAPTTAYYLVGTNNGWNGAGYQFAANPAAEGEYMLDVTFAANDEFKVIGVLESDTTWFPAEANNCTINEEGLYTVYFRPDYQGGQDWYAGCIYNVKKEAPIVHQYEVAEAIAAGLADDTEIMVRGVVTKIEFKGKNFAKYGSANIYVADATGAEGAFEFYNCYSLDADTFRTSSPEYDATSTALAEFDMVADENGNEVHVGDTVVAFGKYKLYNTTHELNTGCYIVDVIPGEGGGEETIGYDYEPEEASQFNVVIASINVKDYTADFGVVALELGDAEGVYFAYLEYLTSTYDEKVGIPAGTYQISNSEAEGTFYASPGGDEEYDYGCYFGVIDGDYYTPYYMVSGTVTIYSDGSMLVNATSYFGSTIELVYGNPVEAVENTKVADNKVIKFIEAGKVVIRKNGVKYNVVGQMMK